MTDILVCGDLHGKIEIARDLLQEKGPRIIFIGDYLDSFDRTIEDQQELLEMVLDAVEINENVSALMGNHELSYLEPDKYKASGYKWVLANNLETAGLLSKIKTNLDLWIEEDGFLFSHAGMSLDWIPEFKRENPREYLEGASLKEIYRIGHSRGGFYPCGGLLWCDYNDEFKPVPGIKQVFGHTAYTQTTSGIRTYDDENYCIDCLDRVTVILEIKNGVAKPRYLY
jgi:hypothetical protein